MKVSDTGSEYELPPEGATPAVCVDVVELGIVTSEKWGDKEKVRFVFETPHKHSDEGYPLRASTQMNVSFSKKGRLRPFLGDWRGKQYTDAEAKKGVDLEMLVGKPAYITIEHSEDGRYANITNIIPLPKGLEAPEPDPEYKRVMDREEGWDVRSPKSKALSPNHSEKTPRGEPVPAGGDDTWGDDLPF